MLGSYLRLGLDHFDPIRIYFLLIDLSAIQKIILWANDQIINPFHAEFFLIQNKEVPKDVYARL
jgi:hypothetical protein